MFEAYKDQALSKLLIKLGQEETLDPVQINKVRAISRGLLEGSIGALPGAFVGNLGGSLAGGAVNMASHRFMKHPITPEQLGALTRILEYLGTGAGGAYGFGKGFTSGAASSIENQLSDNARLLNISKFLVELVPSLLLVGL